MSIEAGEAGLYVVATPIGNLGDVSERAREILTEVDLIAAEDTRHSGRLLMHLGVTTPQISLHEHNERDRIQPLLHRLQQGESIALISDAGTPLISDPGMPLVREARVAGVAVYAVPGPCALIAALSVSGLPTNRFVFEGFLPQRAAARRQRLSELADETRTLVFYESPHRIAATLADMRDVFGAERGGCVARELTKRHETVRVAPLQQLVAYAEAESRGEWVIVVSGGEARPTGDVGRILDVLSAELPLKQAAKLTAKLTGASRNEVYALGLAKKDS